jgi:hypothetical protein
MEGTSKLKISAAGSPPARHLKFEPPFAQLLSDPVLKKKRVKITVPLQDDLPKRQESMISIQRRRRPETYANKAIEFDLTPF